MVLALERPVSARSVVLKPVKHSESTRETKAEKHQVSCSSIPGCKIITATVVII